MHFAYPPRKNSNPPPFRPRSSAIPIPPLLRRIRLRGLSIIFLSIIGIYWLLSSISGHGKHASEPRQPSGHPPVVLVSVLDERAYQANYLDSVRENRIQYAKKHGYDVLIAKVGDYDLHGSPKSWSKVVAMRHALAQFPDCRYVWYLDEDSFIMNPNLKVDEHVMGLKRLESLMIKDHPVVPPDSIIKTFSHLRGDEVDFVLSQDSEGLSAGSFIVRNGEWAKFFLDTWFDPLYRSYNFQKAETHALEHIVQWHPTILSKLALVPQRTFNSYNRATTGEQYEPGDLVVRFPGCEKTGENSCQDVAEPFLTQWKEAFGSA